MNEETNYEKFLHLRNRWYALNETKNSCAFGEEDFDRDRFAGLVRDTFQAIRDFKQRLLGEDLSLPSYDPIGADKNVTPEDMIEYGSLLAEIGKYSAEMAIDESEDRIFTASQAVTRLLLGYAFFDCGVTPTDDTGVLIGTFGDCEVYPVDEEDRENLEDRNFHYDTNTGDLSEMIELAKLSI